MKITLANAEAALHDVLSDADQLHSRELRAALEKYVAALREQIKTLRKMLN
ncbi:hypothetical protein [Bradyrhizobium frederickii]|uniref:hypothetical protein n=1 Tax=Bradyrhizobium frederickii TaxID=2560054 RepID=UPI0014307F1E|nr:hypothetical protein [Bradyrhizobium frederickii]